jgi:hypothetical protein
MVSIAVYYFIVILLATLVAAVGSSRGASSTVPAPIPASLSSPERPSYDVASISQGTPPGLSVCYGISRPVKLLCRSTATFPHLEHQIRFTELVFILTRRRETRESGV